MAVDGASGVFSGSADPIRGIKDTQLKDGAEAANQRKQQMEAKLKETFGKMQGSQSS